MAVEMNWCHLHSQRAENCKYDLCRTNANDPNWPGEFARRGLAAQLDADASVTTNAMEEQFNELAEMGVVSHEIYLSHLNAGFTPQQALWLTGAIASTSFGTPPDGLGGDDTPA